MRPSLHELGDEWLRNVGMVGVFTAILFVVLLGVFFFLVPLSRQREAASTQERETPTPPAAGLEAAPTPTPVGVTGPLPTEAEPVGALAAWTDERYGFRVLLPERWRPATVDGAEGPLGAADYDVVFEDPATGARLAASVWEAAGWASFGAWATAAAPGYTSVDGGWPTNAVVAGHPALVVWSPETPTSPLRYAALLEVDGRFYRLAHTAPDGGGSVADFARALVSLGWAAEETVDLIPPLPAPSGRYYPSERLFDR